MKKKFILLFVMVTSLIVLNGCGSSSATGENTIKIMAPLIATEAPQPDNEIELAIEEFTGYDIDMIWVPDSQYIDKFNVTMASGDLPNIIISKDKSAALYDFIGAGAYWQIDDYIGDYENLNTNSTISENASFNGAQYGVYRPRDLIRSTVMMNKKWLDNLGLEVPQTLDEFMNMCDQFTNNDPDGDGEDDTYCISVPNWGGILNTYSPFDMMTIWFGVPNKWGYDEETKQWLPDFMFDEYMDALDFFNELYTTGYMNEDFAVLPTEDWPAEFINQKAGVIVDTQSQASGNCNSMKELDGNEDADCSEYVAITNTIETDAGKYILPTTGYSGLLMFPKQSDDEEKLKQCLDFVNKLATPEGVLLLNSGIKGVDYTLDENGNPIATDDFPHKDQVSAYAQISAGTTARMTPQDTFQERRYELQDEGVEYAVSNPLESLFSEVYAEKGANMEYIMSDARIKYIAGAIDAQGYQEALDLWLQSGGQEYIDEMNQLANDSNIEHS